jgi:hypothetical protein
MKSSRDIIQLSRAVDITSRAVDIINILPLIEGVMVDYHTQKTNIIRDEIEGDIVVL